jgi:hypothetical protein
MRPSKRWRSPHPRRLDRVLARRGPPRVGLHSSLAAVLVASFLLQTVVATSSARAQSSYLTVQVAGTVVYENDFYCMCLKDVYVGSPVTGYYVYDLTALDTDPDPAVGLYEYDSLPSEMVLIVGDHEYRSDPVSPEFYVTVHDSVIDIGEDGPDDLLRVLESNPYDARFDITTHFIYLELRDTCLTALGSDELPTSAPALGDWPQRKLSILGDGFQIRATLDTVVVSVGPERVPKLRPDVRCYPNPTNGVTTVVVRLPEASVATADVWSVDGRRVTTLARRRSFPAGVTTLRWDGADARGRNMPSGVYFVRVTTGETSAASRLVFVR